MATREQMTTALLTEHLRYTPLTLLDDIINTVNELVYQAVNNIETALLSVPPNQLGFALKVTNESKTAEDAEEAEEALEQAARTEIEGGIVKLESLLNATVDKDFDKLEIYTLRNLLTVSNAKDDEGLEDWIMLDHYKNLQLQDQTSDAPSPESLDQLRRKVAETEKLQALLRAETAKNEAMLSRLRPLISQTTAQSSSQTPFKQEDQDDKSAITTHTQPSFSFLTSTPSAAALGIANPSFSSSSSSSRTTSLAQNTGFTYSQLCALKEVVQNLRSHLATMPQAGPLQIPKEEEERHNYLDTQARRAMDRSGVQGQTGLGGQEDMGRRAGRDEIRAIEGIVGALGSQRGQSDVDKMEE